MRIALSLLLFLPLSLGACSAEAPSHTETPARGVEATETENSGAVESGSEAESTAGAADAPGSSGVKTDDGVAYGAAIGEAQFVALSELVANTSEYEGEMVRVEGLVTDVCAKRGCWMNIGAEEGPDTVQFKVTDGVMVFPMDAKGSLVSAEGTVVRMELDLETTRNFMAHKAEEAGEEFDESSVTEPMVLVRLTGSGAVIRSPE